MASRARSALLTFALMALFVGVAVHSFVPAPTAAPRLGAVVGQKQKLVATAASAAAAGLLSAGQAAHAEVNLGPFQGGQLGLFRGSSLLFDEILPVSLAVSGATLWGIILGFVLLRLQEAFPE